MSDVSLIKFAGAFWDNVLYKGKSWDQAAAVAEKDASNMSIVKAGGRILLGAAHLIASAVPAGCGGEDTTKANSLCNSTGGRNPRILKQNDPQYPVAIDPNPFHVGAEALAQEGGAPVSWPTVKPYAESCDGSYDKITVTCKFVPEAGQPLPPNGSLDPLGNLVLTYKADEDLKRNFSQPMLSSAVCTASDHYGNTGFILNRFYPEAATEIPQAGIIGPYAARVNENIGLSAANADEAVYSYTWDYGDGTTGSGSIPAPKAYTQTGTYTVMLTVARLDDPTVKSVATQSIAVVPQSVEPPALSLNAPYAAYINEAAAMTVVNPDTANWDYTWEYGDGSPLEAGTAVSHAYTQLGTYTVKLTATNKSDASIKYYLTQPVSVVPTSVAIPSAVISSNLKYSYNVGSTQTDITAYSDDLYATFKWTVTRPDGNIEQFDGATIPAYTFGFEGDYDFRLEVTGGNGATKNYETRSVSVYPVFVAVPQAGIVGPFSVKVNQDIALSAAIADEAIYSYIWDYGDGTTGTGSIPTPKAYTQAGTYTVMLTVARLDDPTVKSVVTQSIAVVPQTVEPPALALNAPYAAYINEAAAMTVVNPDTANWDYTWEYGDGSPLEAGTAVSHAYTQLGTYTVKLTATNKSDTSIKYYLTQSVSVVSAFVAIPSAVISGNLKYSYNEGDTQTDIAAYSDDLYATFKWSITTPDGNIETFDDATILSYTFALKGDYDFRLEVTGADGATKNYEIRPISVYPVSVAVPQAGIIGPFSAKVNQDIALSAANADEAIYSYTWDYGDGTTGSGSIPAPKAYTQTGTYTVMLTVARLDDPTVKSVVTQSITVVPQTVEPPTYQLDVPGSAEEETAVNMAITLDDPAAWTVDWQYGDGSAIESGTAVSHAYAAPGKYGLVVTLTNVADPDYKLYIRSEINVVPHGNPVASLAIQPTNMGPVPFTATFDASQSHATAAGAQVVRYKFTFGDGSIYEETAGSAPDGIFDGITDYTYITTTGTFTVELEIEDSYGKVTTINSSVTTWAL